jgi:cell shape-determining protein MreC
MKKYLFHRDKRENISLVIAVMFIVFFEKVELFYFSHFSYQISVISSTVLDVKKYFYSKYQFLYTLIKTHHEILEENKNLKNRMIEYKENSSFEEDFSKIRKFLIENKKSYISNSIFGHLVRIGGNKMIFFHNKKPEVGDIVVSDTYVIGRVSHINNDRSEIISITNKDFKIKVTGMNNNSEGIIYNENKLLTLSSRTSDDQFDINEILFCNIDGIFFIVGTIKQIKESSRGKVYIVQPADIYSSIGMIIKSD